jgi:release factor glutamine methyltransferase
MTFVIKDILQLSEQLKTRSDTADLDIQILLCHVLKQSRSYLYSHPEQVLSDDQQQAFFELLASRRSGVPVAYLTGLAGFWTIELSVNRHVLVPRPETELLIELALSLDSQQIGNAVDLGTGSGAIAISLAKERPEWQLTATDISAQAINVARTNAQNNNTHIEFVVGSWYEPLASRSFDLIVSNPPYIRSTDEHLQQAELKHEPLDALVSDDNGLTALSTIITGVTRHLRSGGWIILEHGYDQSDDVCALLTDNGFSEIEPHQDNNGVDRAVMARLGSA